LSFVTNDLARFTQRIATLFFAFFLIFYRTVGFGGNLLLLNKKRGAYGII